MSKGDPNGFLNKHLHLSMVQVLELSIVDITLVLVDTFCCNIAQGRAVFYLLLRVPMNPKSSVFSNSDPDPSSITFISLVTFTTLSIPSGPQGQEQMGEGEGLGLDSPLENLWRAVISKHS